MTQDKPQPKKNPLQMAKDLCALQVTAYASGTSSDFLTTLKREIEFFDDLKRGGEPLTETEMLRDYGRTTMEQDLIDVSKALETYIGGNSNPEVLVKLRMLPDVIKGMIQKAGVLMKEDKASSARAEDEMFANAFVILTDPNNKGQRTIEGLDPDNPNDIEQYRIDKIKEHAIDMLNKQGLEVVLSAAEEFVKALGKSGHER